MAFQGEREPGVLEMDVKLIESMAQDGIPEQEMLIVQEQFLPQPNPEPEMGAVAEAAVDDTSPSLLHQLPPPPQSLPNRLSRAHPTWPSYSPCWRE